MIADKELTQLIEKLPADSYESGQAICEQLLSGGKETVVRLVEIVGDQFGDSDGIQPKYALHGAVHHASRPGAETQRKLVAETLIGQLDADHSDELKAFIVRQLQLCGRAQEISKLAALLDDERLCDPAVQAITAIGGNEAIKALRTALPKSDGRCKLAIEQAIKALSHR